MMFHWIDSVIGDWGRIKGNTRLPFGSKFLRALIFGIFTIFSAIRKNKFPQIKIIANIFPPKICSRVNLNTLHKNTLPRNHVCWITLVSLFRKQRGIQWSSGSCIGYARLNLGLFKNMYFYCTYSIKTKILSMLGTGYFLKIAKINSQQEKPNCPNRKI